MYYGFDMNEHVAIEGGVRLRSRPRLPFLHREAKSREARVIQWALDPNVWVGLPCGVQIPVGKDSIGVRYIHRRRGENDSMRGKPNNLEADVYLAEAPSTFLTSQLKGLVYVVQAVRAIGLAIISCHDEGDPTMALANGLVKFRREALNLAIRHGNHGPVMAAVKVAFDWFQWRKMGNEENSTPDLLPDHWWGCSFGIPINPPLPKYILVTKSMRKLVAAWKSRDKPLSKEVDLLFCRILAGKRGLPPGDKEVCESSIAKHREMFHNEAPGPWRENVRKVQKGAEQLARKHHNQYKTTKTHVSVSTSASWEVPVEGGGKNAALQEAWAQALETCYDLRPFARTTLIDGTGQKIHIPRLVPSAFSLIQLYLYDITPREAGGITLEDTISCKLGGPLVTSIAILDLVAKGYIRLRGSVLTDCPLWSQDCKVPSKDRMILGPVPLPARVVTLPEEGWKGRTLSIPPWPYALVSACARHWFQANLLAAEPRVSVGFESQYKLWNSVKNLGAFPKGWLNYPHVSGDVSQCTDSTALEVHAVLLQTYLSEHERLGTMVPACVWICSYLLCSSHTFVYAREDTGDFYTVEGDHQTGIGMGEGLSFISMLLQNLILDDEVTRIELSVSPDPANLPIALRPDGLTDIIGDDYLRKFCSQPYLYSRLAWDWFSWLMSKGKNGVSQTCLQLAEEWGYADHPSSQPVREGKATGRWIAKQDVIKIKYFAVPGPNSSKDSPAWVGRCSALAKHLDWCPDIRKENRAILVDAFRSSYSDIPREIPLNWALPGLLGGVNFPTTRSAWSILRKMKLERSVQTLLGLPRWELQATLRRLSSFHMPYGTGKGVGVPKLRNLEVMLGGFSQSPSVEFTHQPILAETVARFLMTNPSELAPRSGWKWNASLCKLAPSQEQIRVYMKALNYVPTTDIDAHALRLGTLKALVSAETLQRASLAPRHGRSAALILERIVKGVIHQHPLTKEGWEYTKELWATRMEKVNTPTELGLALAYFLGPVFIKEGSAYAEFFDETYPWSFNFHK